jgi:hypothetical protein
MTPVYAASPPNLALLFCRGSASLRRTRLILCGNNDNCRGSPDPGAWPGSWEFPGGPVCLARASWKRLTGLHGLPAPGYDTSRALLARYVERRVRRTGSP